MTPVAALKIDSRGTSLKPDYMQETVIPSVSGITDFEQAFKTHFKALHAYAFAFVKNSEIAEDIVQGTFMKLWEKSAGLHIQTSLSAYLYRSVYNECLNYLKHEKVKINHASYTKQFTSEGTGDASESLQFRELENTLRNALGSLPEGCRTIFQMSRFESLKYQEIANKLDISIKTVENQMGKALKILRLKLKDHLPLLMLFFFILTQ